MPSSKRVSITDWGDTWLEAVVSSLVDLVAYQNPGLMFASGIAVDVPLEGVVQASLTFIVVEVVVASMRTCHGVASGMVKLEVVEPGTEIIASRSPLRYSVADVAPETVSVDV